MQSKVSSPRVKSKDREIGFVESAQQFYSPNYDQRPPGVAPEVIIIHAISLPPGQYGGNEIIDLFCNRLDPDGHPYFQNLIGLKVSAHLLVRRDGQVIQFVSLMDRAWHAGRSVCLGRSAVNDFSIGIELEGCDEDCFEPIQYDQLNELINLIIGRFPKISRSNIFGHSEIAPGRKTDPGPHFDWSGVRE